MISKPTTKRFKLLRNQRGFTLIEMVAVAVVAGIGIAAIFEIFIAARSINLKSGQELAAAKFAQQEIDYYRTQLFTTDFTPTGDNGVADTGLESNSTDVSASMPSILPGTLINCGQANSGNTGRYACVTTSEPETGRYLIMVFVGWNPKGSGSPTQKQRVFSAYVSQYGVGTNPTIWHYYFNDVNANGGGPTGAAWTNPLNGFDGSTSTSATTSTNSSTLIGFGTNVPQQMNTTISSVKARVWGQNVTATLNQITYGIGASPATSTNYSPSLTSPTSSAGWSSWSTITAPGGGWTWPMLHDMDITITGVSGTMSVSEVQLRVFQ